MKHLFAAAFAVGIALAESAGAFCDAGHYANVSGHCVRRPIHASHAPAGATAKCNDGSSSFSERHRGTCSHHGGVAFWRKLPDER